MELEKYCADFMLSIDDLVQNSISSVEKLKLNGQKELTETFAQVINVREQETQSVEDLKESIKVLENTHQTTKNQLSSSEKKFETIKKEKECVVEHKALKKKELARIKKHRDHQAEAVKKIEEMLCRDQKNSEIVHRNKNELFLYKRTTGISWDFRAPPHLIKGYVTNKETSFLKSFCFNKETMSKEQIVGAIWNIISLSSFENAE